MPFKGSRQTGKRGDRQTRRQAGNDFFMNIDRQVDIDRKRNIFLDIKYANNHNKLMTHG